MNFKKNCDFFLKYENKKTDHLFLGLKIIKTRNFLI